MSRAVHCDLPRCDTWALVGPMAADWVNVYDGGTRTQYEYCSGAHAWQHLADLYDPLEEVGT